MRFKYGLKAQKLLAQGIALGIVAVSKAPCKGKSLIYFAWYLKAFALTGRQACVRHYPGRCPGLGASALSGRMGAMHSNTYALYLYLRPVTVGSGRMGANNKTTT